MSSYAQQHGTYGSYHQVINSKSRWHPRSSLFDKPMSQTVAELAIREGDALRERLQGRRILECV